MRLNFFVLAQGTEFMRMPDRRNMIHNLISLGFIGLMCFVLVAARKVAPVKGAPVASDQEFANKAATGGMLEVKLGELAAAKGSNPAVREFGQRMVKDHSKANDELKSLATQASVALPTALSRSEQTTYDRLSKLSGADFDKAYANDMVSDHEHDVAEFKQESTMGQNETLKSFAMRTLPTLQSHLDQAREMLKSVQTAG
jgi:putative membrane protein